MMKRSQIENIRRNLDFDGKNEKKRKSSESSTSYETCSDVESMYSCSSSLNDLSFNEVAGSSPIEGLKCQLLEQCNLEEQSLKKIRLDSPRSSSAPNTPLRPRNLKHYELTPSKSLGTPERNEILYPSINERPPPNERPPLNEPKTSETFQTTTIHNKKKLFTGDFIESFLARICCEDVLSTIFNYLDEKDLASCFKVSKVWRHAIKNDRNAFVRYLKYKEYIMCSKENVNLSANRVPYGKENKPSPIPKMQPEDRYIKLAKKIGKDQKIEKCLRCAGPSVLDYNGIAQCASTNSCGYIWCTKCSAGSEKGPEHFLCYCEKGNTPPPTSLEDISNTSACNYYMGHESAIQVDSGYASNSDSSLSFNQGHRRSILSDSNCCSTPISSRCTPRSPNAADYSAIAFKCKQQRIPRTNRNDDPSSPPRVKHNIIGSKKSKKNLRRL